MSLPSKMMWPSEGSRKPPRMRSRVVLPQPDGPQQRHKLIFIDVEVDALENNLIVECLDDVLDLNQFLHLSFPLRFLE
jgi:hypothetical protein